MTALTILLAPVGATHALGLGSAFSNAEVEVSIVSQSKSGVVLDVHGTDYTGRDPGIEIALNPAGFRGSGTRSTFIKSVVHNPADPDDWTYRFTLDAAQVAALDPDTDYQIMTMRAEGRDVFDSSDSRYAGVPFDFGALSQPPSSPDAEEPSSGTGSSDGSDSGSGAGSGSGSGSGSDTSPGRTTDGDSNAGSGAGEKPRKKASEKPWTAPEEPPTAKGLELTGLGEAAVDADEVIHARASGFKPHETGIKVVVYSTPLVLSTDVKANGRGVAKWSGRLPKDIGLGKHTLTFQGSVNRGIRFVVTGTPSDGECVQSGCAPATAAIKKSAPAEEGGVGPLTWIIVATMIVLALAASAIALMSGRRKRDREWDDPAGAQARPRYPSDPYYASEPYPTRQPPIRQPQPRDETPLPRRLPPGQQPAQHLDQQPAQHLQSPRQRDQRQPGPRQPSHRQPVPQPVASQPAAPPQPAHRQPRPPESFAPPSQRSPAFNDQVYNDQVYNEQAYEDRPYVGQRIAGR
ncbi:hypothetical protein WBG06_21950 [Nocardioides sp. CCNWLW239]|uniref:hypothetical protein n=1 Tax=Nocardioides sp. CCNWLW239 TaxID=3128902 RepID=UPI0030160120